MASNAFPALEPGATIGILGGGQLGRMLALAAARLGLRCHVYSSESDACAFEVVQRSTLAAFSDQAKLEKFARDCDVITYEFENVPAEAAAILAARKRVLPDPKVLATTQDRLIEKQFLASLGIATAKFAQVDSADDLARALRGIGRPAILKTRRLGYDGKGQAKILPQTEPPAAFREIRAQPSIVEAFVPFEREISVIAARGCDGRIACFDATENEHRDHILRTSRVPAAISAPVANEARQITERIAAALDFVGVLAVEMFVVANGQGPHVGPHVLVNEIAPRVHNSGHWTIDGASVSQFEQHIRAVAGWPLVEPVRLGRVEMFNLIGPEVENYAKWLAQPGASVHLYGKTGARPGRKMGHVTRVFYDR
jgi:5-(carboxyamino)imidazole ribonucleotide synthase